MSKIRVLILVDKFDFHGSAISGPLRNYSWLVQRLDSSKFDIFLYTLRKAGYSSKIFEKEGVKVIYLSLHRFNPLTFLTVFRLVLKHHIDLLHLQGYGSVVFGQIAGILTHRPIIIKEEWVDPEIGYFHCWLECLLSLGVFKVIAISNYAKKFLIEKKRIPKRKIVYIPNGIPLDKFRTTHGNSVDIRIKWAITANQIVVGIVGMLHENKGHRYFLEAASQVVRKYPDSRYLIVGDGEERRRLEKQVGNLNLSKNVIFTGQQEKMEEIYPMMDIYVLASSTETFPTSLIEAMASGCAVVSTRCGGSEELIVDHESGIFIPIRDSDAMAKVICFLIEHQDERLRLAQNAVNQSLKHDIVKTVSSVEQLYESVFNRFNRHGKR